MNKKIKHSGFTLIELMVVASMISTLGSIVFATSFNLKQRADVVKFKSDLVQIRTALSLYVSNSNGNLPVNLITLNDLTAALYSSGVYGSNTVKIPTTILSPSLGTGAKHGSDVGCGSAYDYLTSELVFYFSPPDGTLIFSGPLGTFIGSEFEIKYHGTIAHPEYRCFKLY